MKKLITKQPTPTTSNIFSLALKVIAAELVYFK